VPVKPSRELLAEALVSLGRTDEAGEQLVRGLARTPRRARSLTLLAALGNHPEAANATAELAAIAAKVPAEAPPWLHATRTMAGDAGLPPVVAAEGDGATPACHRY
jgi:predicted Zn-dependent protease